MLRCVTQLWFIVLVGQIASSVIIRCPWARRRCPTMLWILLGWWMAVLVPARLGNGFIRKQYNARPAALRSLGAPPERRFVHPVSLPRVAVASVHQTLAILRILHKVPLALGERFLVQRVHASPLTVFHYFCRWLL
uniref:Uncharacterized protein n=1 Tax=Anopheles darlingi TaxID=43151 RepID=A0A2M4D465_ANODA